MIHDLKLAKRLQNHATNSKPKYGLDFAIILVSIDINDKN